MQEQPWKSQGHAQATFKKAKVMQDLLLLETTTLGTTHLLCMLHTCNPVHGHWLHSADAIADDGLAMAEIPLDAWDGACRRVHPVDQVILCHTHQETKWHLYQRSADK